MACLGTANSSQSQSTVRLASVRVASLELPSCPDLLRVSDDGFLRIRPDPSECADRLQPGSSPDDSCRARWIFGLSVRDSWCDRRNVEGHRRSYNAGRADHVQG